MFAPGVAPNSPQPNPGDLRALIQQLMQQQNPNAGAYPMGPMQVSPATSVVQFDDPQHPHQQLAKMNPAQLLRTMGQAKAVAQAMQHLRTLRQHA